LDHFQLGTRDAHLIRGGSGIGSRDIFSSSSSISATFHCSLWICHIPRPSVKSGIMPSTIAVPPKRARRGGFGTPAPSSMGSSRGGSGTSAPWPRGDSSVGGGCDEGELLLAMQRASRGATRRHVRSARESDISEYRGRGVCTLRPRSTWSRSWHNFRLSNTWSTKPRREHAAYTQIHNNEDEEVMCIRNR